MCKVNKYKIVKLTWTMTFVSFIIIICIVIKIRITGVATTHRQVALPDIPHPSVPHLPGYYGNTLYDDVRVVDMT